MLALWKNRRFVEWAAIFNYQEKIVNDTEDTKGTLNEEGVSRRDMLKSMGAAAAAGEERLGATDHGTEGRPSLRGTGGKG